ncbi:uncharacterized protein LOC135377545 [Ornithodoros turicata]|uniref:uncharacterized protein LOC135377545 n=1 Tax=Ornithodoros turicata TaxID=34597 RepID=UPI003139FB8D
MFTMFPLWVTAVKRAQDYPHHSPEFAIPQVIVIGGLFLLILSKSVTAFPRHNERSLQGTELITSKSFYDKLLHPCKPDILEHVNSSESNATDEFSQSAIRTMLLRARAVQNIAVRFMAQNFPYNCSWSGTMEIPNQAALGNETQARAISWMYKYLLTHSAYAYFLYEETQMYPEEDCLPSTRPSVETLRENAETFAVQLRDVLCVIKMVSLTHGGNVGFEQYERELPTLRVRSESNCSRRMSRDCEIMASSVNVLQTLTTYLSRLDTSTGD